MIQSVVERNHYRLTAPLQTDFDSLKLATKIKQLSWTEVSKILETLASLERGEGEKVCVGKVAYNSI